MIYLNCTMMHGLTNPNLIVFRKLIVVNLQNQINVTYEMCRRNAVLFNVIKLAHVAICAI